VLLIDALRDDRVGPGEFPALATLARESLRFSHAFANSSSTKTSLAAMMTGRLHPPLTTPNVAQRLRAGGKRAALVWLRHLMEEVGDIYPVLRGFDPLLGVETTHQPSAWGSGVSERTSEEITQRVLALLDSASPPDLIWAHYFDVHQWSQLFPGPRERAVARYDAAVRAVDRSLAPLLARRDGINLVLLADHGESLNALDRLWHTTYVGADVVRVPWLIRVPGLAPAVVAAPIGLTELTPTLLDLLGVALSGELAGRSALGLVGVDQPGHGPPIIALETREWSILADGLRLRYAPHSRSFWLHDLAADPDERIDISPSHPDRVAALRGQLLATVRAIEREHGGELRYGYE
jgi:arylsulfatase A-like enzyme